jgi:hypothetical protein
VTTPEYDSIGPGLPAGGSREPDRSGQVRRWTGPDHRDRETHDRSDDRRSVRLRRRGRFPE